MGTQARLEVVALLAAHGDDSLCGGVAPGADPQHQGHAVHRRGHLTGGRLALDGQELAVLAGGARNGARSRGTPNGAQGTHRNKGGSRGDKPGARRGTPSGPTGPHRRSASIRTASVLV